MTSLAQQLADAVLRAATTEADILACGECGQHYPCRCDDPRYQCGGCLNSTSESELDNVVTFMRRLGMAPTQGVMCPSCFVDMMADGE
jgi:hypothetical protein